MESFHLFSNQYFGAEDFRLLEELYILKGNKDVFYLFLLLCWVGVHYGVYKCHNLYL
jgi:hypothetical protein